MITRKKFGRKREILEVVILHVNGQAQSGVGPLRGIVIAKKMGSVYIRDGPKVCNTVTSLDRGTYFSNLKSVIL